MDTDDEQVLSLLVESFLLSGRVSNVTCLIAFHPQYLESFLRTEYFMFKGEGPLPFDWRCYIAIMVREYQLILSQWLSQQLHLHEGNGLFLTEDFQCSPKQFGFLKTFN